LAGILPEGIGRNQAQQIFVENLTYAAEELKKSNIKLLIEPINTFDMPGFFLSSSQHALETIMAVQSNNLYLQYDAYHAHRMGEDILGIEELKPGTGEINYPDFFMLLDDLGYEGWVGCEYKELHQANFLKA
jgi:hydroxypyruvate isomerase